MVPGVVRDAPASTQGKRATELRGKGCESGKNFTELRNDGFRSRTPPRSQSLAAPPRSGEEQRQKTEGRRQKTPKRRSLFGLSPLPPRGRGRGWGSSLRVR